MFRFNPTEWDRLSRPMQRALRTIYEGGRWRPDDHRKTQTGNALVRRGFARDHVTGGFVITDEGAKLFEEHMKGQRLGDRMFGSTPRPMPARASTPEGS